MWNEDQPSEFLQLPMKPSAERLGLVDMIPQILECRVSPAVLKPDPQRGVHGVLERYKLE